MGAVQVEFEQDLVDLLEELHRPVKQAARELIALELYRQGEASSGKAAELLGNAPARGAVGTRSVIVSAGSVPSATERWEV